MVPVSSDSKEDSHNLAMPCHAMPEPWPPTFKAAFSHSQFTHCSHPPHTDLAVLLSHTLQSCWRDRVSHFACVYNGALDTV